MCACQRRPRAHAHALCTRALHTRSALARPLTRAGAEHGNWRALDGLRRVHDERVVLPGGGVGLAHQRRNAVAGRLEVVQHRHCALRAAEKLGRQRVAVHGPAEVGHL